MALSKQKKNEVVDQYKDWLKNSESVILVEYTGATMKDMENIRAKVRESGGEFHVVKNTLVKLALESGGYPIPLGRVWPTTESESCVGPCECAAPQVHIPSEA